LEDRKVLGAKDTTVCNNYVLILPTVNSSTYDEQLYSTGVAMRCLVAKIHDSTRGIIDNQLPCILPS